MIEHNSLFMHFLACLPRGPVFVFFFPQSNFLLALVFISLSLTI
uniref:Uncharacterized protein n=1 Tax=Rhizophora mucronata TaxID=61149 RepID=A0A2P2NUJ9_RHIMU